MLADRFGRKNIIVYCTALQAISPVSYLFASTWQQLVPGIVFEGVAWALYTPARQALISESLPHSRRGAAFGAFRAITSLPRIVLPILSGILLDQLGVVKGVRIGFVLIIIGHIIMTLGRGIFLRETLNIKVNGKNNISIRKDLTGLEKESKKSFLDGFFSGLSKLRGSILAMLIVATISSFTFRMVQPFLVVYAINVIELTKTQWGAIQTVIGAIGTVLLLPSGILSDRYGRRFPILLARLLGPFHQLSLLLLRDFNQILLLNILVGFGAGLGGEARGAVGGRGGPAWSALVADLVPSRDRGKIMGLMSTITGIASMPSSVVGGFFWTNFSPDFLLTSAFFMGMVPVIIFYFFVKEPKKKET
jgi:MFS family permease